MTSKKDEFIERIFKDPVVVGGLAKIEDDKQRDALMSEIKQQCSDFSAMYEVLSNALDDPEILKQVVEELKGQNDLVNDKETASSSVKIKNDDE